MRRQAQLALDDLAVLGIARVEDVRQLARDRADKPLHHAARFGEGPDVEQLLTDQCVGMGVEPAGRFDVGGDEREIDDGAFAVADGVQDGNRVGADVENRAQDVGRVLARSDVADQAIGLARPHGKHQPLGYADAGGADIVVQRQRGAARTEYLEIGSAERARADIMYIFQQLAGRVMSEDRDDVAADLFVDKRFSVDAHDHHAFGEGAGQHKLEMPDVWDVATICRRPNGIEITDVTEISRLLYIVRTDVHKARQTGGLPR
jgi:hypothetical protein